MSAPDLSGLERAAGMVGLRGIRARVVPPDPRRGWWFRWSRSELRVSERIIERCPPGDAPALLVNTVLEERILRVWRWAWLILVGWLVVTALTGPEASLIVLSETGRIEAGVITLLYVVFMVVWRQRLRLQADDQTVSLLGDAESLVRGLNAMGKEELHFGSQRMPARPDLHKRAERLVAKHRLCSAPPDGEVAAGADGARGDDEAPRTDG